ncbi:hypothetical protein BJV78DRAFT_1154371 [Lactifluus subvellereus]|nr:hypothetical protein BJV78DRAFT_1154371 [Lactifluus subvellereus]
MSYCIRSWLSVTLPWKWKYYFRVVRPKDVSYTIPFNDGDEIEFGKGNGDSRICNLHLAIAWVFAASGATDSEVFDEYLEDEDDSELTQVPIYFGDRFVADDLLLRRLEDNYLILA